MENQRILMRYEIPCELRWDKELDKWCIAVSEPPSRNELQERLDRYLLLSAYGLEDRSALADQIDFN